MLHRATFQARTVVSLDPGKRRARPHGAKRCHKYAVFRVNLVFLLQFSGYASFLPVSDLLHTSRFGALCDCAFLSEVWDLNEKGDG